tara:strand:+ start:570 stop:830 length:261 start_codon:yes stop_codon:yes gene_type:complete
MALAESIEYDKIEIVGEYKSVQVREATVIKKDGKELTRSFRRYVLHPNSDISGEPAEVQAVCNAVWTDAIKTAYTEFLKTAQKPGA